MECGNVQLLNIVNPELLYVDYLYKTSVSLGLPEHFMKYADEVIRGLKISAGELIVEIGSNEGAMLRCFKSRGMRVLGIDPARDIAQKATENGVETIPDFFNAAMAQRIKEDYGTAHIIIANNVFANIDDLSDIINGIRALLAPEGVFVFETSYLFDVIEKNLIDTIFHEHISYFAVKPLEAFFKRNGMQLIDVLRVPTKGGSIRCTVQMQSGTRLGSSSVKELVSLEMKANIYKPEAFVEFELRLNEMRHKITDLLTGLKSKGKTIACYGASVGITTMIYHFNISRFLDFIVDDNPLKHNTYSPGHHLPVFNSDAIYSKNADCLLVLAWRYFDKIKERHKVFKEQGGFYMLPLPEVSVV
jgi:SAM-dependent methyltransferase